MIYIFYFCEWYIVVYRGIIVYLKELKIRKEYFKDGVNFIFIGIFIILSSFLEI